MSFIKIIDTFSFYGLDIAVSASLTCILVQIIKAIFGKKVKKKIFTFLPFLIGTVIFAAYYAAINASFTALTENFSFVLERGVAVGSLSTVIYVWYEQFIREKKSATVTEGVIAALIEGYVPDGKTEQAAKRIAEAVLKDVTGDGANKAAAILKEDCQEGITERDIELLSKLIIETLAHTATNV